MTCRGNERRAIFEDEYDRKVFLEKLTRVLLPNKLGDAGKSERWNL